MVKLKQGDINRPEVAQVDLCQEALLFQLYILISDSQYALSYTTPMCHSGFMGVVFHDHLHLGLWFLLKTNRLVIEPIILTVFVKTLQLVLK